VEFGNEGRELSRIEAKTIGCLEQKRFQSPRRESPGVHKFRKKNRADQQIAGFEQDERQVKT